MKSNQFYKVYFTYKMVLSTFHSLLKQVPYLVIFSSQICSSKWTTNRIFTRPINAFCYAAVNHSEH